MDLNSIKNKLGKSLESRKKINLFRWIAKKRSKLKIKDLNLTDEDLNRHKTTLDYVKRAIK